MFSRLLTHCSCNFFIFCFNISVSKALDNKLRIYISMFKCPSAGGITSIDGIMFQEILFWIRCLWNPSLLRLGDCYEVDCSDKYLLGSGTYGTVWRGRNVRTPEEVAVKKVRRSSETRTFIQRELGFMTTCNHKNIIKLLWSGEDKFSRYFVMDFCPLGNLNEFTRNIEISLGLCFNFMRNLAEAVLYLHERNIAHRDIKPLNILVKENGGYFLLLADFGLARYFPTSSTGMCASHDTGNFVTSL